MRMIYYIEKLRGSIALVEVSNQNVLGSDLEMRMDATWKFRRTVSWSTSRAKRSEKVIPSLTNHLVLQIERPSPSQSPCPLRKVGWKCSSLRSDEADYAKPSGRTSHPPTRGTRWKATNGLGSLRCGRRSAKTSRSDNTTSRGSTCVTLLKFAEH